MNLLNKTKVYLVGPMQYCDDGRSWREDATLFLRTMGITVFDPYHKPFVNDVDESEPTRDHLLKQMEDGDFQQVAARMKRVRAYDLSMVDRADFIICYLDPQTPTVGTYEELFWAVRLKRPIFLIIEGGKTKTPLWLMGTLPHKYIYNNLGEVLQVLQQIDSGAKEMDSDRWRLFRHELR